MPIDKPFLQVLEDCANKKLSVFFSGNSIEIVFQTFILSVKNQSIILENKVPPQYISKILKSSEFSVNCQMIRFSSEKIESDGCHIIFPLESTKIIEETRGAQRFPFHQSEKVVVKWINPYDKETELEKSVIDMSSTGLSMKSKCNSKLYSPGTEFKNMQVLIDGKPYNQSDGKVIYNRCFLGQDGKSYYQIGIQFE